MITIYRRKIIQVLAAVIYNLNFKGFAEGSIYRGRVKGVCVPGLNCYSCPGAIGACPLGSLQSALSDIQFKLPLYIAGTLIIFGILLGRAVCAFLCPFGLIQELLYKIPSPKIKKNKWTRRLSYLKYAILLAFVFAAPIYYMITSGAAVPAFCKYICPAGTLEGGIPLVAANKSLQSLAGGLFVRKVVVLITVVALSVFLYRFFCRFLCPLGAIYSFLFFNRHAIIGVDVDQSKCTDCGNCVRFCKMDTRRINDRECLRCGDCKQVCRENAIISKPHIHKKYKNKKRNEIAGQARNDGGEEL